MNKKISFIAAFVVACILFTAPAQAHLVAFGWKDLGNGTIRMFGEHWHGDQIAPSTANGGVRIGTWVGAPTDPQNTSTWYLAQWTGVLNNMSQAVMLSSGTVDGIALEPANYPLFPPYEDWFFTDPLVLGNGTWGLFTGTICCIDTMSAPGQFVISGISSVPPGTGPGPTNPTIPEPATMALLGSGLASMLGLRRKKTA